MQKFVNNYETTLTLGIDNSVTSIHVAPSTKFDDLSALTGGDYYLLTISDSTNIEIVKVTAVSVGPTMILTVERDASESGHGSFSFSAGAAVKMNVTAEGLNSLAQVVSNANYPPNYTTNVQTKSTSGTVSVPFTPLVIQQVNIDTASGVTLNVTPGATWGECIITLYRTNLSHAWPSLTYNGNVVPIAGYPPGSGVYNAKLLCRSEPGAGYLPNPFVTFEWVTVSAPATGLPYQASGELNHGIVYTGQNLYVYIGRSSDPIIQKALFQPGTYLTFYSDPSDNILRETFFYSEGYTGIPTIALDGFPCTVYGTPPTAGQSWMIRALVLSTYFTHLEWVRRS